MPRHTLVLLRHAKSDRPAGVADLLRPLAARGVRQAQEAGRWLAGADVPIEHAAVSPAERARATLELAAAEWPGSPAAVVDERIYDADAGELLAVVRGLPEAVTGALLVGHNPGFEVLASRLAGRELRMRTAEIAVLALETPWAGLEGGAGRLVTIGRPPS